MGKYPRRDSHFAHKLIRLMIRCCAAQEIGTDGFLLVTVIAHTEDAKRYVGPVTFWNDQLISVLGFNSWGKLDRARKKAVAAGWLHYEAGKKGIVGKYWATVPRDLEAMPDTAVDSDYPHVFLSNSEEENERETGRKRGASGGETGDNRGASGDHSTLTLNLDLQEQPSVVCSEPPQAACPEPPSPPEALTEFVFPVRGKGASQWWLPAAKLEEYRESFPGMDVEAELRKARQWARDNPSRRKTPSGMLAFLTRWLSKAANNTNGGYHGNGERKPSRAGRVEAAAGKYDHL